MITHRHPSAVSLVLLLGLLGGCASAPPAALAVADADRPAPLPGPSQGTAQEAPPAAKAAPPEWEFALSLYLWLASKSGVIDTGTVAIPLDDPDESTGVFLYLEGERGRWGFLLDLDYLESEDRVTSPGGTIEVDEDTLLGELDATFRPDQDGTLQLLVGLRVLDSSQEIRFPVLPDRSSDVTQLDPVFGAQGTWELGERWRFRLRGDVGGFGVDSDFTYQGFGVLAWEFVEHVGLTLGYRVLGWEFEDGGVDNDLRLSGWLFGLAGFF